MYGGGGGGWYSNKANQLKQYDSLSHTVQVSCGEIAARKDELTAAASGGVGRSPCGVKNPSL